MSEEKLYAYTSISILIGTTVFGGIMMFLGGLAFGLILFDSIVKILSGNVESSPGDAPLYLLPFVLGFFLLLMAYGAFSFISRPSIRVTEERFQLQQLFYRSKKFKWAEINSVQIVTIARQETFLVQADGLNWLYQFVGINLGSSKRQVAIGSNIQDYAELVQIFRTKRPELFKNEGV